MLISLNWITYDARSSELTGLHMMHVRQNADSTRKAKQVVTKGHVFTMIIKMHSESYP